MSKIINLVQSLSVTKKKAILIFLDFNLLIYSYFISYIFINGSLSNVLSEISIILIINISIFFLVFKYCEIYSSFIRFENLRSLVNYFKAILIYSIIFFFIYTFFNNNKNLLFLPIVNGLIIFTSITILRYFITRQINKSRNTSLINHNSVIIYGAGKLGYIILNSLREVQKYKEIFFIDDDNEKVGRILDGIKVYDSSDLLNLVNKKNVDEIIIAIANNHKYLMKKITNIVSEKKISIKIAPSLFEKNYKSISYNELKDIDALDIISSKISQRNQFNFQNLFKNERILITGGGGSIGSELVRQISTANNTKIFVLDFYEYNLYKIENDIINLNKNLKKNIDIEFILFDIKNENNLKKLFEEIRPTIIFHAAAYKHVPIVETNPLIGINNNFLSTVNLIDLSIELKVKKLIFISTDKAVYPNNIMGMTKRLCEMYIKHVSKKKENTFSIVRFGNVVGSSGSVIPLFIDQIKKGGPLTVTDPEVTRYFMTIPDAVSLIINATFISNGGEVFVLDMGKPIKIVDIANQLKKLAYSISNGNFEKEDIDIVFTGLRKGEKMHEEIFFDKNPVKTENDKIFVSLETEQQNLDIKDIINRLRENVKYQNKDEAIKLLRKIFK